MNRDSTPRRRLLPLGLVLAFLVILGSTLEWSTALVYALAVLMLAAFLGANSERPRIRRKR